MASLTRGRASRPLFLVVPGRPGSMRASVGCRVLRRPGGRGRQRELAFQQSVLLGVVINFHVEDGVEQGWFLFAFGLSRGVVLPPVMLPKAPRVRVLNGQK